MVKKRINLHPTPEFLLKLKQIQGRIQAECGEKRSLSDLTGEIIRTPAFTDVEKQILEKNGDFIKWDRRIE